MADETTTETEAAEENSETTETSEQTETTDTGQESQSDSGELDKLRAALKNANKEAEKHRLKLKEIDDAKLSEIEKAKRDADEATRRLQEYERKNLRQSVALDLGVPAKWVNRLQGETEDELRADAAAILADLKPNGRPTPDASQGPRTNAVSDDDQFFESIYGKA